MRYLGAVLAVGATLAAGVVDAKLEHRLEPSFRKGGHIHGYLITPAGQGLSGVVALCTPDGRKMTLHTTNGIRRGRFDMDNLLPGRYLLRVDTIGPFITDLEPPADVEVEVRAGRVSRPHLVAR